MSEEQLMKEIIKEQAQKIINLEQQNKQITKMENVAVNRILKLEQQNKELIEFLTRYISIE